MISEESRKRQREAAMRNNLARSLKAEQRYLAAANTCKRCGKLIPRNPRTRASIQVKQKYCGRSCSFTQGWENYRVTLRNTDTPTGRILLGKLELRPKGAVPSTSINWYGRKAYDELIGGKSCELCGYEGLALDICHIKPTKEFSEDTTVLEINDTDNLIKLCKNHHWEFDHGSIPKSQIESIIASRVGYRGGYNLLEEKLVSPSAY